MTRIWRSRTAVPTAVSAVGSIGGAGMGAGEVLTAAMRTVRLILATDTTQGGQSIDGAVVPGPESAGADLLSAKRESSTTTELAG